VLELALDEARELNPKLGLPPFVDTEHLLLGLIRESDSTAVLVLHALGVDLEQVRREVVKLLGGVTKSGPPTPEEAAGSRPITTIRPAQLIDINTRVGYDPRTGRNTTPDEVMAAGKKWGVEQACVYHINAVLFDTAAGNQATLELCRQNAYFRPVAVLAPFRHHRLFPYVAMKKPTEFAFARIFPDMHAFALDGLAGRDLLIACGDVEMPVMVSVQAAPPVQILCALGKVRCTLILTGIRYHQLGEVLTLANRVPNLYIDISGVATPDGIKLLAEAFGAERLLFGSEYPFLQVGCAAMLLQESGLSEEECFRIRYGNATRLWGTGR